MNEASRRAFDCGASAPHASRRQVSRLRPTRGPIIAVPPPGKSIVSILRPPRTEPVEIPRTCVSLSEVRGFRRRSEVGSS